MVTSAKEYNPYNPNLNNGGSISMGNFWSDLWNGLTGQTQEDRRTQQTNEYNYKQVQSTNEANKEIARETNMTNYGIAMENLYYQRELQEYNKALQQQIFDREDTAYERTKKDMLNAGLNPLTMQGTNGAGEVIAQQPLNNQFQAQQPAAMQAFQAQKANLTMSPIQAIGSIASGVSSVASIADSLMTGQLTRDKLRLENDRAAIDNLIAAKRAGVGEDYFDTYIDILRKNDKYDSGAKYSNAKIADYNAQNAQREYNHKVQAGKYDSDSQVSQLLTDLTDWLTSGRGEDAIEELANKYPQLAPLFTSSLGSEKAQAQYLDKHPKLKNYIKMFHKDMYYKLYPNEAPKTGTTENSSGSSHSSGKF